MANYHQLKNAAILTPTESTDLGSNANRYANVFMSGNIVMSNGVTVTSTNVITPKVSAIAYPGNDTAADIAGGQTITITGTGFSAGASVLLGTTPSTVVTVVSSTSITFTSPVLSAGNYALYVINSDGGTAIYIPGIAYSGTPTWSTSSGNIASVYETNSISSTVAATGDATISYSLNSGTLPTGSTLNSSTGLISGTAPASAGVTTYSFSIRATDGQNQDTDRSFTITVNTDSVSWSSPADNTSTALAVNSAMSTVTLSATSAAGKSITYTANALPTGVSISTNTIVGTPTVVGSTTSLITATAANSGRTATRTLSWVVSVASDTYWPYTVLLLNGEGTAATDNAQNNTVIDSSTNAFTITKQAGTTGQGTFSPFSARGWSNYFPAGALTTPASAVHNLGTGDFTVELWYNQVGAVGYGGLFMLGQYNTGIHISLNNSTYTVYCLTGSEAFNGVSGPVVNGEWNHVALTRSGTTLTLWHNGVSKGSVSSSATISPTAGITIGATGHSIGSERFNGYISNVRLVKGTCLYTSTFTPSTTELTAITGTTILACQSNRFKDNSENNWTFTVSGTVSVKKFSPFNGTAEYGTTTYGGSLYFDTSTYYTLPYNAAFGAGTGDFTLEAWVYPLASSASYMLVDAGNNAGGRSTTNHSVYLQTNNSVTYLVNGSNVIVGGAAPTNQWTHIAIVRISGSTKLYLNGIQSGSTWADSTNYGTQQPHIGRNCDGNYNAWNGYISGLRFVKGTGVYTTTFTPPTSPLTAVSGTSYLLSGTNAGIIDQTGMSSFVNQGTTAKITTANKKYGNGSMSFTASNGDYFTYSHPMPFPTAFTIELWFYATISQADKYLFCGQNSPMININGTMGLGFAHPGAFVAYTSANYITTNTWYHLAYVREGLGSNQTKLYLNGTVALTGTESATFTGGGITAIGAGDNGTQVFTGYIDDVRVTYYPRYTTTFTPPTSSYKLR
jgi:hypothetical protein